MSKICLYNAFKLSFSIYISYSKATAEQLGEIFDMLCEQLINRVIMHRLLDIFVKGSEQSPAEVNKK